MSRFTKTVQAVITSLPDDAPTQRKIAAWLGLLQADLHRVFSDADDGVPLGATVSPVVGDAEVAELRELGIPAELLPRRTRLEAVSTLSLKISLLGAITSVVGYNTVEGLGGMVTAIPEGFLLYGMVIPTALAFVLTVLGLPIGLSTGAIGFLRRRSGQRTRSHAQANVDALASRGVHGPAATVDARARALARHVIRARLPEAVESDVLQAIEDSRRALRQLEAPSAALVDTIAAELDTLQAALNRQHSKEITADDVSAPLVNLRRTVHALRQG